MEDDDDSKSSDGEKIYNKDIDAILSYIEED
jgi:hypothetical protein